VAVGVLVLSGLAVGVATAGEKGSPGTSTVNCPAVADKLPAVPASARAEVDRDLALLDTQIAEANKRLASSQGEGGVNVVNNAILGPLKDKRLATLDRIAIAIGRQGQRPAGLAALAPCTLNKTGASASASATVSASASASVSASPSAPVAPTVKCPSVEDQLPVIPRAVTAEVTRNLAQLDKQIGEANRALVRAKGQGGPNFINNAILNPLKAKRLATIDRIANAIARRAPRPGGLRALAPCTINKGGGAPTEGGEAGQGGPFAKDFIDIRQVKPNVAAIPNGPKASTGRFIAKCGNNEEGHANPDNFIVAPGVSNGAQHMHDYVGNVSTDGFSTNDSLKAAGTTCARSEDKSAYFWPVLRIQDGTDAPDVNQPGGGVDKNIGQILPPSKATLEFRGNPTSKVQAMPAFIRVLTGNAKAATNNGLNARAQWTCSGFTNRISTTQYAKCPRGSQVIRIADFPSCWDGVNTDSANHRTHILFPDAKGACPAGTKAVPQLRITIAYDVPQNVKFAVDGFPDQLHNPITDHNDFVNVMSKRLMTEVVNCINSGRRC
jgi:hypothetical protein